MVVHSVSVRSVTRVVFALSLSVWGIAGVGIVALYLVGLVSGGLGGVEGFIASLGFTGFRLSIFPFLAAFILAAGLISAVLAIIAGVIAHLYNLLDPLVGGVELRTQDEAPSRSQTPPQERPRFEAPRPVSDPTPQWPGVDTGTSPPAGS